MCRGIRLGLGLAAACVALALAALCAAPGRALAEGAVASVTDSGGTTTGYDTLDAAVGAAGDGSTVTLLADVEGQESLCFGHYNFTLDLNGHDIVMADEGSIENSYDLRITNGAGAPSRLSGTNESRLIEVQGRSLEVGVGVEVANAGDGHALYVGGGEATVTGGSVTAEGDGNALDVGNGGEATVTGGSVTAEGGGRALCVENGGEATVTGGSVTAKGSGYALCVENGGEATVTGGAFKAADGVDPIYDGGVITVSGGIFSSGIFSGEYGAVAPPTILANNLAEGYDCVDNDDVTTKGEYPWRVVNPGMPRFAGHSLLLTGQVGLQFLVELPKGKGPADYEGAYVTFSGNKLDDTVQYQLSKAGTMDVGGSTRYVFTVGLSSIQLADKVTPTLHYMLYGNDEAVTGDAYAAQDYLDWAIADGGATLSEQQLAVVKALADYGYHAQRYLSAQNGWTIGTDYAWQETVCNADMSGSWDTVCDASESYALVAPDTSVVERFGHRLVFGSTVSLEMRLRMADGSEPAVTVDGTKAATTKSGSYYVASVRDIYATQLATMHPCTAGGAAFTISPMSYVHTGLGRDTSSAEFKNLLCALYFYGQAAAALA